MVLSFSNAADAMMFSVGWQAVDMTTSEKKRWGGKIETVPREVQSITNILHPENN